MTADRYLTPMAFKQALEQRLRTLSASGVDFARRRQLLVFDRFLARVQRVVGDDAVLKGGLVLELRLARARTTKDVDLRMMGSPSDVLDRLQEAGRLDLGDAMRFEIQPDSNHPEIHGEGMNYDGYRFIAECRLAGKVYAGRFGVDVGFGDPIADEPDVIVADDVLSFAGIEPPALRIYPVVSHVAEKLHAYTIPRSRPNSRIKDLPDLALLASVGVLDVSALRRALKQTFAFRETHELPVAVPRPPEQWAGGYGRIVEADGLAWHSLHEVHCAVGEFLDPVLGGAELEVWDPTVWSWRAGHRGGR